MLRLRKLRCSFCRKDESEVAKLVAGPRVYICDACVAIATKIIEDSTEPKPPVVSVSLRKRLADAVRRFGGQPVKLSET